MKKITYILVIMFFATSCVVKPFEQKTPKQLELDSQYQAMCDTTQNIAQESWREIFTEPELQNLIDSALHSNFDYQSSLLRVEQSYAMLRSARAQMAPTLNLGANYQGSSLITDNTGKSTTYSDNLSASLNLGWELDLWGKLYAGKEAQIADFWASTEAAAATAQSLIAATAAAYYELLALREKEKVVQNAIDNRTEYVNTTKDLKESGKVNEVAVQQAVAQLSEAQATLPQIRTAQATTLSALALLCGKTTLELELNSDIHHGITTIEIQSGTPVQLLSFRPDVRAAEMNYRAKHYLEQVARAALYPSLSIGAGVSLTEITTLQSLIFNTVGGLTQPIFNGRQLRSQREIARAEAKIAEISFQQTLFEAVVEVNNAVIIIANNDEILEYQKVQLGALRNAYEYSGDLFLSGYANYLDVLVAQTNVFNAELSIVDTYLNYVTSRIELYRAVGGGSLSAHDIAQNVATKHDPLLKQ